MIFENSRKSTTTTTPTNPMEVSDVGDGDRRTSIDSIESEVDGLPLAVLVVLLKAVIGCSDRGKERQTGDNALVGFECW